MGALGGRLDLSVVAQGRVDEALRYAPRERPGVQGDTGAISYGRTADGGFELKADHEGDVWLPAYPVLNVSWSCAVAYGRWKSARTGQPWRLPGELEWEKSARGVDGRPFPWGDHGDPSWMCMRDSREGRPAPAEVTEFPVDTSVYGVRGAAGNVHDWCADPWVAEGPMVRGRAAVLPLDPEAVAADRRVVRGGLWIGFVKHGRCGLRWGHEPTNRFANLGFRLARSVP